MNAVVCIIHDFKMGEKIVGVFEYIEVFLATVTFVCLVEFRKCK